MSETLCKNCGQLVEEGALRCMHCGTLLKNSEEESHVAAHAPIKLRSLKHKRKIFVTWCGLAVITVIAFTTWANLTYKTKNGGPMAGIANRIADVDGIKERGRGLDDYQEAIKERIKSAKESDTQLELSLMAATWDLKTSYNHLKELKRNKASQEKIEDAQRDLFASSSQSEYLLEILRNVQEIMGREPSKAYIEAQNALDEAKK